MLFASYRRVTIREEFHGGLSGSRVLLVRPIEREDSPDLPIVVKIAPADLIRQEARAYREYVHQKLPGIAEIAGEPVFLPDGLWGGLRYTLMGEGGTFEIESLRSFYGHASAEDVCYVLQERLFKIIGPNWWQMVHTVPDWPVRAGYDFLLPVNLLIEPAAPLPGVAPLTLKPDALPACPLESGDYVQLEGFIVSEVEVHQNTLTLDAPPRADGLPAAYRMRLYPVPTDEIRQRRVGDEVTPVAGRVIETRADQLQRIVQEALAFSGDLTVATLTSPHGTTLPNPLALLPTLLSRTRNVRISTIHGDLNLENILVEPTGRTVSLIDFATVRRDHALHDLLRLETEVVTKLLPEILAGSTLLVEKIRMFYEKLHEAASDQEHRAPARPLPADLDKPFQTLATIRSMARQCLFDAHDWGEYYEGLALYLVGALKFKNLDQLSKRVTFWTAAVVCNFVAPVVRRAPVKDWRRLQKYLPAELYQARDEAACLPHLNALLRAVLPYVQRHVALDLLQRPAVAENMGEFLEGTLLFADISGFTNLSEKLKEMGGKIGAEEVTRVINEYLDVMLEVLSRHNGLLIKFGGDAMLCLFTGREEGASGGDRGALDAVRAAWEMKQVMVERFGAVEVFQQIFPLSMKVGGNSGLLFAANVGTPEHMEYVLTGSAVERTAHAESAASRGDVLISHETYELIGDQLEAAALEERPGFYRVTNLRFTSDAKAEARRWTTIEQLLALLEHDLWGLVDRLDSLTPYLPAGALPLLVYDPYQGQIEGQHRQATVVFVNFVGMSDIIQARGTDDVDGVTADLSEYFRAMQEEVQYYGGAINKVDLYDQGDKLMVVFGAPVAHEQDAERAALTALAMQEALKRLSSPTISAFLTQRIGIHTGFVFAGNVGSAANHRCEYTVMGDTVNLAARLMSAAPPDQVWVSQQVWEQIQAGFEAQALPPIRVKGISEPLPVYQLQMASRIQWDRGWSRVLQSDIVGREAELETLAECFDDLLFGVGKQVVAIVGEVGVGKSRLVQEWQRRVAPPTNTGGAAHWLTGRAHSYGQKTHGVLVEVLERLLGFATDAAPEEKWKQLSGWVKETFASAAPGWFDEFSNRLAYLGHFLTLDLSQKKGLTERVTRLEAETLQIQTRLAICELLECAARERPLVLLLDDLHWADDASLDLLKFLVDRLGDTVAVLFCLIYRPQKERPIWQTWREIERAHPDCRTLALLELEAVHGRRLLSNLLQTAQLPEDFQALVLTETDGNPLYIEEVLHTFIEDGVLVQEDGGWRLTQDVAYIQVPDTLYQIIQSRIDDLDFSSPGARRALWIAAVIGDEFAEELALHLFTGTGRQPQEFRRHLRALQNAAMIEKVKIEGEGRPRRGYCFRHGLVQQVAYENMPIAKRREYHAQVGQRLEKQYGEDLHGQYDTLAYHYDRGEEWEKAAHYHRLAGMQQMQSYANREAALHLRRALEIAERHLPPDEDTLLQVHEALGRALEIVGEYDEALAHLTTALHGLGDGEQLEVKLHRAQLCYHIGYVHQRQGALDEAWRWRDRGLTLLPTTPTVERAQLHTLGTAVAYHRGDHARLKREAELALAAAQAAGAQREEAQAHNGLHIYYRLTGDLSLAAEHCRRSADLYADLKNPIGEGRALMNLGVVRFEQDDWPAAENAYQEAAEKLARANEAFLSAMTYGNLGDLYCHQGRLDEALACAERALERFTAQAAPSGIIFAHAVLATIFLRQGALESARSHLEQARELIEAHRIPVFAPTVGRWLARVHLEAGDVASAEAEIQALLALDAESLDVESEPIQRLHGQILAAQDRLDEAADVLQASLVRLEQQQARYQTAQTQMALAGVFAQMAGRAAEARTQAERARATFADLGAGLDVQKADELLAI